MLLHGLCDGGFVWNTVALSLQPYVCIAPDLRGHGDSPSDMSARYRTAAYTSDVFRLIIERELDDLTLVGHSLGAAIAVFLAAQCRARIRNLVIVDGGPNVGERAAKAMLSMMTALPRRFGSVAEFAKLLTRWRPFSEPPVIYDYARSALRFTSAGDFELKFDPAVLECPEHTDSAALWAALRSLECRTLLVRGSASSFLTATHASQVSHAMCNCRSTVVPRSGHAVPLDNPSKLAATIREFLSEAAP